MKKEINKICKNHEKQLCRLVLKKETLIGYILCYEKSINQMQFLNINTQNIEFVNVDNIQQCIYKNSITFKTASNVAYTNKEDIE